MAKQNLSRKISSSQKQEINRLRQSVHTKRHQRTSEGNLKFPPKQVGAAEPDNTGNSPKQNQN